MRKGGPQCPRFRNSSLAHVRLNVRDPDSPLLATPAPFAICGSTNWAVAYYSPSSRQWFHVGRTDRSFLPRMVHNSAPPHSSSFRADLYRRGGSVRVGFLLGLILGRRAGICKDFGNFIFVAPEFADDGSASTTVRDELARRLFGLHECLSDAVGVSVALC